MITRLAATVALASGLMLGVAPAASAAKPARTYHCFDPGTIKNVKVVAYWYDGVFKGYVDATRFYREIRPGVPHLHLAWLDCR